MKNDVRLLRALMMKRAKQLEMTFINTPNGLTIFKSHIGKLSELDEFEIKRISDFFDAKTLFIMPEPDFEGFERLKKESQQRAEEFLRNENSSVST